MKYRAEIDGLRALAVIPVILFHAGFELFSGGFIGVDVFFVISGYLITTILIDDLDNKRFSLASFYERRARRILPALSIVMLSAVVFAWALLSDAALYKFGDGLIGVALFVSNIVFLRQQGYFDESAELNPLLHTWSLSVEEQFYVLFPIFLLLAWRFGKYRVFWMIGGMAAVSLLLSEWGWRNQATANFFLAPSRAWELLAGSIAALIVQQRGVVKNDVLALLGLGAIIVSIFAFDERTPFPSVYALLPVLGVVLLVLFADKETLVAKVLSAKVFVAIGLLSYSAYLWHQPIFAFTRVITNEIDLGHEVRLILILLVFLLSYLSWKYVEKPFRNPNFISRSVLFSLSFSALLGMALLGVASKKAVKGNEYQLAKSLAENEYVYFENMDERKFLEGRLIYPLKDVDNMVVGSSRVMQINASMIEGSLINLSVSGASIEDDIAFALEAMAKIDVKHVYISADPWIINQFDEKNRYQSVSELYSYWLEQAKNNSAPKTFFSSNPQYTVDVSKDGLLASIRKGLHQVALSIPKDGSVEARAKKAYDGSHIYNEAYVNNARDVTKGFPKLLNYGMEQFAYDDQSVKQLQLLVSYLKRNGITVSLVLSPYHPGLYQQMEKEKPIFIELEQWFRRFSEENGIAVLGSYDPRVIGCLGDEFFDGMHPKSSCMSKLFTRN